tara:strand:+ start:178 stop:1206 length:1029 start_codon:yes stop_codon:yes gene_type:complete
MCILECNAKVNNKYGGYCYKHRRLYLIEEDIISIEKYTGVQSDYLRKDMITSIEKIYHSNYGNIRYKKKDEIFQLLDTILQVLQNYSEKDIQRITKLQRIIKNKNKQRDGLLRGEGYLKRSLCKNQVDFYTFETIDEIDPKYFFSYKDEEGMIWFFDIRSFNKLVEMNQGNPYTRKMIPKKVIERSKKLIEIISTDLLNDEVDQELVLTKKQMIKQKTIDIFSQMEQYGYSCNLEWFFKMNLSTLKKLYRSLEDIWNYRLNLTYEVKSRISPPNGLVFNIPVNHVYSLHTIEDVQDIILTEVMKFNNAISNDDRKLGYMYFLIGLTTVSKECYDAYSWMIII